MRTKRDNEDISSNIRVEWHTVTDQFGIDFFQSDKHVKIRFATRGRLGSGSGPFSWSSVETCESIVSSNHITL